jgi:hypothetical protein
VPAPLITPLDVLAFYPPAQSSDFHTALQPQLDDLDTAAADTTALNFSFVLPDVIAIALSMDTPIKLADDGFVFEATDLTGAAIPDLNIISPLVQGGMAANETNIDAVLSKGQTLNLGIPPIAGAGSPSTPGSPAAPAPVLPAVGSGAPFTVLQGAQAFITNINRPAMPGQFRVGDPWQITIKAAAGTKIYAVASHNGVSLGQAAFGTVPVSGILLLHGTFTADQLGSWQENWYGENKFIAQIVFQVGE